MGPSNDRELAQLVERHPYKVDVAGSNPVLPTKLKKPLHGGFFNFSLSHFDFVEVFSEASRYLGKFRFCLFLPPAENSVHSLILISGSSSGSYYCLISYRRQDLCMSRLP